MSNSIQFISGNISMTPSDADTIATFKGPNLHQMLSLESGALLSINEQNPVPKGVLQE